nr:ribonuclease H-like domain-containing protein [Tanacetum cinerariifolium]
MAFVSSSNNNTSSTNAAVNTAHRVFTASIQVNAAYSPSIDNLSDVVICSFFASQPNGPQLVHEDLKQIHPNHITINGNETIGFDKSKAEEGPNYALMAFSSSSSNSEASNDSTCLKSCLETVKLLKSQNDQLLKDLKKFELMVLDEFVNKSVVENCKAKSSEEEPKVVRKNDDVLIIKEWVSDNEEEDVSQPKIKKKIVRPSIAKIEFVKSKQQEKTARKTVKQVEQHRQNTHTPRGNERNWNNMMPQKLGINFEMFNKACYVCGSFDHLQIQVSDGLGPEKKLFFLPNVQSNPQIDLPDQGVIDNGCSRYMTGNISYLIDYEEIYGGYVAFGGNPKEEKITGKVFLIWKRKRPLKHNEIANLKMRVKKLKKKNRSRTHKLKRLYKVGLTSKVESSRDEEGLGEDASKQGRRIDVIDADEDITMVNDVDKEMFDVDVLGGEEMFVAGQNENVVKEVVDVSQVCTAAITVTINTKEITLAQALEALKTSKLKVKGIVFQEPKKSTTTISSQQSQDNGKGIMIEEPVKPKKKDQIMFDEEAALKLQAEFDKEERLAREKAEKEQEANIALIEE